MKAHVNIYRDKKKEWRWHLIANGHIMADSGEGYTRRRAARRAWIRFAGYIMNGTVTLTDDERPTRALTIDLR
jgi:uncharacterized protein YegP (UPF0339 family)